MFNVQKAEDVQYLIGDFRLVRGIYDEVLQRHLDKGQFKKPHFVRYAFDDQGNKKKLIFWRPNPIMLDEALLSLSLRKMKWVRFSDVEMAALEIYIQKDNELRFDFPPQFSVTFPAGEAWASTQVLSPVDCRYQKQETNCAGIPGLEVIEGGFTL